MIVVATAHDQNYSALAAITRPSVEAYCRKHDYHFHYEPEIDPREGDACKIRIFNDLYATGTFGAEDLYFWIDTDALVMNSAVTLESIREMMGQAHVLYGQDVNGINTGTWMARFTSRADHFLRVSMHASFAMGWSDQPGIFQTSLQEIFKPWVKYVPGKRFNAMPYELYGWDRWSHGNEINAYAPGDFIVHLPGIESTARMELLREYAKHAV